LDGSGIAPPASNLGSAVIAAVQDAIKPAITTLHAIGAMTSASDNAVHAKVQGIPPCLRPSRSTLPRALSNSVAGGCSA